jgi:hypothetical protein
VKRIKPLNDGELQILLDCCRQQLGTGSIVKEELDAPQIFNAGSFLALVAHHRLFPVVYQAENQKQNTCLNAVFNELKNRTERNRQRMLKLAAVLLQINELLNQANIDFISYKGPLMVNQIYGDLSKRQTRDLDILIRENDLENAIKMLTGAGYKLLDEYFVKNASHRNLFLLRENHLRFCHPDNHIILELHWSLSKYFISFNTQKIFQQSVSAQFMGKDLGQCLCIFCLFFYVHMAFIISTNHCSGCTILPGL